MKARESLKKMILSEHIPLALVAGASIIVLALVSKRLLAEPIDPLLVSIPGLMVVAAEATLGTKKKAWYTRTGYWMIAIALVTILIIALHLI